MKIFNNVSIVLGVLGGFISAQLGGYDQLLSTLMFCTRADWITGVIKSVYNKDASSKKMFYGICKTIAMYTLVGLSVHLSELLGKDLRSMTIWFFIGNEGLSVLENASVFLPIPQNLKEVLSQIRG